MTTTARRTEVIATGPAEALAGLLGVAMPDLSEGEGLPPMWHWVYLLDRPAQIDLGTDGHPSRGAVVVAPGPGRRRMAAGGRVDAIAPLRVGVPATRTSSILRSTEKEGRSGRLTFVTVGHEISQDGRVVIAEEQDLVYRDAVAQGESTDSRTAEPALPSALESSMRPQDRKIEIDPVLLFRFSALTYNAHRIHYDRDYARDVEGYPGLVVHGPLQVLLMAEAVRATTARRGGGLRLEYRLVSPLFEHQGLVVGATHDGVRDAAVGGDLAGRTTATLDVAPA